LNRQRSANGVRRNRLSYQRTELRAVRHHKKSPDERKRRHDPHRRAEKKADEKAACSADTKRDCHEALAPDSIRRQAAPDTPRPAYGDSPESNERDDFSPGAPSRDCGCTRCKKRGNPGPERVELEHVTKVAAGGKTPLTHANDVCDERPRKRSCHKWVRTFAISEPDEEAGDHRTDGRRENDRAHSDTRYRVHEIRSCLSDRERSNDCADRKTALGLEPGGDHLHRRGIDAGQKHPCEKP